MPPTVIAFRLLPGSPEGVEREVDEFEGFAGSEALEEVVAFVSYDRFVALVSFERFAAFEEFESYDRFVALVSLLRLDGLEEADELDAAPGVDTGVVERIASRSACDEPLADNPVWAEPVVEVDALDAVGAARAVGAGVMGRMLLSLPAGNEPMVFGSWSVQPAPTKAIRLSGARLRIGNRLYFMTRSVFLHRRI